MPDEVWRGSTSAELWAEVQALRAENLRLHEALTACAEANPWTHAQATARRLLAEIGGCDG